ncbi:hypothetical protein AB0K25_20120 [Micromonospora sp. NPDC049257]|uniref:hypothetical protein n=1 Tax=Micromonospora sp. NPDC049257 TaxID=3155771 RepID=UPI00344407F6
MPKPIGLPHGVRLPRTFTETDARDVFAALARAYGWTGYLFGRTEAQARISPLTLTDAEWQHLHTSDDWNRVNATARRAIDHTDAIGHALRQAGFGCLTCTEFVTGPPAATWRRCPHCLTTTTLTELQHQPCPAATDPPAAHTWHAGRCSACTMPGPTFHLTAVPDAA